MCLASTCFPLAYRFASFPKFRSRLSLLNRYFLKRTFASLKKVNKAGNSKSLKIFDLKKSGFFIGGRAYLRFHEMIRFRSLFLSKVHLWGPQNLATINFLPLCIFVQCPWILDKLMYSKEGQILGLDFPKFVQIFASVWGLFHSQSSLRINSKKHIPVHSNFLSA